MKGKISYKGIIMEIEGEVDEISDFAKRLTDERITTARSIIKPTITEVPKEVSETSNPNMPTNADVATFISTKGDEFRHTLKEIELHFLGRTYDGRNPNEKSQYDKIYMRLINARGLLQKKHGGEWKHKMTPTKEREYWLVIGEKQQTVGNYQ